MRILFIGNSLTYVNDLPGLVQRLADATGAEQTYVESVALPDHSLEDHYKRGDALDAIRRGGWRVVIMQQGPSALEESREHLILWTGIFATEIRAVGAEPALYMVWPSTARFFDFDRVRDSYRMAAESVNGRFLAAGETWRAAWARQADLALYGSDGFHPSPLGTYAAAVTIFGNLYQRSVVDLPASARQGLSLSTAEARIVEEAADQVNGR